MRSIVFESPGQAEDVLRYAAVPLPEIKENEVLVKMIGSPVNPADLMFIQGRYRQQPIFPQIAGLEGAGVVVKAGKKAAVPEKSLVAFRARGCWAAYVAVPAEHLYVLPPAFPHEKACQFALNPITAWALLHESGVMENGFLLLTAGNSAVAKLLIQLARTKGIKTIAAIRGAKGREELLALGAAAVVNVLEEGWTEEVLQLTGNHGVQAALDAVGGETGTELLSCLAAGGKVILYGMLCPDKVQFHNATIIMKNLVLQGFGLDNWLGSISDEVKQQMVNQLVNHLVEPDFQLEVAAKFDLQEVKEAMLAVRSDALNGKVLFWNA